jgi:hypothetical protein
MTSPLQNLEAIQPGLRGEVRLVVAEEHTAQHLGSGGVKVLATPQMVLLMEWAGVAAVDHLLPDGYSSWSARVRTSEPSSTSSISAIASPRKRPLHQPIPRARRAPPGQGFP